MFLSRRRKTMKRIGLSSKELNAVKPHFDQKYYLNTYPDVSSARVDPILHFLEHGWKEGRNPSKIFSVANYLQNNPDVQVDGINPLIHYALHGIREGRRIDNQQEKESILAKCKNSSMEERLLVIQESFDDVFYLDTYADVKNKGVNAFEHYFYTGWKEGRNPNREFNSAQYLEKNPEIKATDVNPFLHYLFQSNSQGINSKKSIQHATEIRYEYEIIRQEFDEQYYLSANPDVRNHKADPLEHFCKIGWKEKRNPNLKFDVEYYLKSNPDVKSAGINPFLHYLQAGRAEGRKGRRLLATQRKQIETSISATARAETWIPESLRSIEDSSKLISYLQKFLKEKQSIVFVISHDDYFVNTGGVQNLIADEANEFNDLGIPYLHLSPAAPLPALSKSTDAKNFFFSVRLNNDAQGIYSALDIVNLTEYLRDNGIRAEIIVHHLMGHSPEIVHEIIRASSARSIYFWAHDFFAMCSNYNLMRNDVVFCNAPPVSSGSCRICAYGAERRQHVNRINALLNQHKATLVAPSVSAMKNFLARDSNNWHKAVVVPLASTSSKHKTRDRIIGTRSKKLKVAFVGYPTYNKGWYVFQELSLRYAGSSSYEFHLFSTQTNVIAPGNVHQHYVKVSRDSRDAMVEALIATEIDVVINWPLWPETFNYILYECLAAGVYVVTNGKSGNIATVITELGPKKGCSLADEADLHQMFENATLGDLVRNSDKSILELVLSKGTAEISKFRK